MGIIFENADEIKQAIMWPWETCSYKPVLGFEVRVTGHK